MIKAAAIASFTAPLEIKQVSIPQPAPNDVLVKLITSDVCHLDLHLAKDETSLIPLPHIVSHEGIGEIVQLGEHAGKHLKMGDNVGVPFIQKTCLHCEFCLSGQETLCEKQEISHDSGL